MSTENVAPVTDAAAPTADAAPDAAAAALAAADAAAAVEPVVPPAATEAEKSAARFAALSRKEKAVRAQERTLSDGLRKLQADREAMENDIKSKYIDPAAFDKNPYATLKARGFTLEQIAEIALNDGKPTVESQVSETEKRLMAKIQEMEQRLEAKETKEKETNYEQVLQGFMTKLTAEINDNPEYELIRANDAVDFVYEVIDTHFNQQLEAYVEEHGEEPDAETRQSFIMSNKDACDKVEKHFLDNAKKHLSLNKIKGLLPPAAEKTASKAQPTLTNTDASTVPTRSERMLSDDDSKVEAAKLIKWNS